MANDAWRYIAMRLDRNGGMAPLDWNLPASGVSINDVLSGPPGLDFTIAPEVLRLEGSDGLPILKKWGTAVFAEDERGILRGWGIVDDLSAREDGQLSVSCVGFSGYAKDFPYEGSKSFVEVDPLDVVRHIWDHIQTREDANLGLEVDDLKTGLKIGTELEQVEFDTQSGPVAFEAGPVKLNWYETHDLGAFIDDLASENGFEWHEEHWWDGDTIRHRIRLGYPDLGQRRNGLRFVYGENVVSTGDLRGPTDSYANGVLLLGRGEGRTMKRGDIYVDDGSLRRIAVVEDKVQNTTGKAVAAARRELAHRKGVWSIEDVTVRNDRHASLGSYAVGDEIFISVKEGWAHIEAWYRILGISYSPEQMDVARLTIQRSDTVIE